eukprot:CFRG8652
MIDMCFSQSLPVLQIEDSGRMFSLYAHTHTWNYKSAQIITEYHNIHKHSLQKSKTYLHIQRSKSFISVMLWINIDVKLLGLYTSKPAQRKKIVSKYTHSCDCIE